MFYLAVAAVAYVWMAFRLVREETPETFAEALAAAVRCALTAAFWLPALIWRLVQGPTAAPRFTLRAAAYEEPWESRGDGDARSGWYWSSPGARPSRR
jgi:ABC-type thiamin/hydroxymethylpyrimidine transport system permease subunit